MVTESKNVVVLLDPATLRTPYESAVRRHTLAEEADMTASLAKHGMLDPIKVTRNRLNILDGHGRLALALKNGLKVVPCLLFDDTDDVKEWEKAVVLNVHRRQLTLEETRQHIEDLLKRAPDATDRVIAKSAGASHVTVGKTRKKLEAAGKIPIPTKRVGADGKERKANRSEISTKKATVKSAPVSSGGSSSPLPEVMPGVERVTIQPANTDHSPVNDNPTDGTSDAVLADELVRLRNEASEHLRQLGQVVGLFTGTHDKPDLSDVRRVAAGFADVAARLAALVDGNEEPRVD